MKVLLLADASSIHTIKWATSLAKLNITIGIWSINSDIPEVYNSFDNIIVKSARSRQDRNSFIVKLNYLSLLRNAKDFLKDFKPDILHAHYATSYGLLGRLLKFKPFIISVWGSDVYLFPKKNFLFKKILQKNLNSADLILSTSVAMSYETMRYTQKAIEITPFGIDVDKFIDNKTKNQGFVIGCIKSLEIVYGIKYLIIAFGKLVEKYPNEKLQLLIGGGGSELKNLAKLASDLGIDNKVTFTGKIENESVPDFLNKLDLAVFPSLSESFGVAAIEASSVGLPVIVSNVGGLPEVVENGVTGLVVEPKDVEGIYKSIEFLYNNPQERNRLGKNGRLKVEREYDVKENTHRMVHLYKQLLNIKM